MDKIFDVCMNLYVIIKYIFLLLVGEFAAVPFSRSDGNVW